MDWKEQAKALPIGQSRKIVCCGNSPSTYVSQTDYGLRLGPCFRCGHADFEPHGKRSASEILAARRSTPAETTFEIPSTAVDLAEPRVASVGLVWFLKAGITIEQAQEFGWLWETKHRRLLLPVRGGYLSRAVFNESPKWLNMSPTSLLTYGNPNGRTLVVVEDPLSAQKLWLTGWCSCAVLGTSINTAAAAHIGSFSQVVGWFDDDSAGRRAFVRLYKAMQLHETTLNRVITTLDPKHIHRRDINARLEPFTHPEA